jgi:hypothetical protein
MFPKTLEKTPAGTAADTKKTPRYTASCEAGGITDYS